MTNTAVRLGRSAMVTALAVGVALGVSLGGATSASAAESTAESTAGSASASAAVRLGPYGYGAVKLGMTAKQAQRTGKIVKKLGGEGCTGWDLKAHPTPKDRVGLFISKKLGVAAIFAFKGARTPEGVGIGSTMKQLKKAYPHIETPAGGFPVAAVPGNRKAAYYFLLSHGKVYEMALTLKNQDCFN
ncbi:hypothetical protein [Microbispora sp. KK1-11]|uniref:hypothetical protein n=1 Tax=Microbispora sp. KK1-11 TaxID=2053005 RepID=UPI0021AE4902|nr:hypothetical protein [Microbispora sp. KK1-11]